MAKKRGPDPSECSQNEEMDMTPMIDVTFLLIIFFMCVTEMSDASKSKLTLPIVDNAEVVPEVIPGRCVINILEDGSVEISKTKYNDEQLRKELKLQCKMGMTGKGVNSDKSILLRADRHVEFGAVQRVMAMCMQEKIWRIAFSTKDPGAIEPTGQLKEE